MKDLTEKMREALDCNFGYAAAELVTAKAVKRHHNRIIDFLMPTIAAHYGNQWIRVDSGVLPVEYKDGKVTKTIKSLVFDGARKIGWYYPDKFKTIEFEDWDDYEDGRYDYLINDKEKQCLWLKEGWYEELEHPTEDYFYYKPIRVTKWQPLPAPPTE